MNPTQLLPLLKQLSPVQLAQLMMKQRMGLDELLDVEFKTVSSTEVFAECSISSKHLQPYGLVHGGLYCSLGESLCSIGGFLQALPMKQFIVGRENRTRFHMGARKGATLHIKAKPAQSEIKEHLLWRFEITAGQNRCASGSVLLALVSPKANIGGEDLALQVDLEDKLEHTLRGSHGD